MKASLIPLNGGSAIEIVKDITLIGRKEYCDIQLDDPSVSKVHLLIAKTDGLLLFRDIGSTNGTKVNGQRVIRGALLPNDKLQIAALKFQVQLLPDEATTNKEVSEEATPESADGADVRVYRAQELARPICPPELIPPNELPKVEMMIETDKEGKSASARGFEPPSNATPPRDTKDKGTNQPPQFVD